LKLADGPATFHAFILVEGALPRIVDADEFLELAPRKLEQLRGL
jgi:hypothetical protein